ncbi:MAG: isocitrate dehydrogenase kinase/phosphatase-domain containing protein [Sulfurifustis sp.]
MRSYPFEILLKHGSGEAFENAVIEYGNAIKDIASANIFPGDMLFKN